MLSLLVALLATQHSAGCASSARVLRARNLLEVARLGLAQIESQRGPVIVVATPESAGEAVAALGRLRHIISPSQIPASEQYSLPGGYFMLQQLSVRGAGASLVGTVGPIFKNHPASCGSTYDVSMRQGDDGIWRVTYTSITMC